MTGDGTVYDRRVALEQLGGDESLLAEISAVFIAECDGYCAALESVLAGRDAAALQREAHTLKSILASFACEAGRELARRLEQLAASGQLDGAEAMTAELVAAMRRLETALANEAS